jgi:hypothetical protein
MKSRRFLQFRDTLGDCHDFVTGEHGVPVWIMHRSLNIDSRKEFLSVIGAIFGRTRIEMTNPCA